ncbi:hypothetical protein [Altererythrobacter sp. MTPC7]|uniref:hypothetical protein n=1 Tax=Altererythrobacter sp. MTPC7 TaxID=3056567 RepID=UPI0036F2CCF7
MEQIFGKKVKPWLVNAMMWLVMGLVIFLAYAVWFLTMRGKQPVSGGNLVENGFDTISVQLDILSLTFAAVGISLAFLGWFSYQNLKEGADNMARKTAYAVAEKVATQAVAKALENARIPDADSRKTSAPDPGVVEEIQEG